MSREIRTIARYNGLDITQVFLDLESHGNKPNHPTDLVILERGLLGSEGRTLSYEQYADDNLDVLIAIDEDNKDLLPGNLDTLFRNIEWWDDLQDHSTFDNVGDGTIYWEHSSQRGRNMHVFHSRTPVFKLAVDIVEKALPTVTAIGYIESHSGLQIGDTKLKPERFYTKRFGQRF